jgi:hypothetical protein
MTTKYQRQMGGSSSSSSNPTPQASSTSLDPSLHQQQRVAEQRRMRAEMIQSIEEQFQIETFVAAAASENHHTQKRQRRGWLYNLCPATVRFSGSALDYPTQ